ncbi:MAG: D-alanyl-D-alanine carboxypeptidase [Acidimicrobiia bacterium]|nr:D-alanyl-D-alanine carboxypeptidase [Acidimicrobiia bacterium]
MTAPRRATHPVAALVVIVLVPALLLFALWRWSAGQAADADPAPPDPPAAPPAPSDALVTPLLSFRRAPGVLSRQLNLAPFQGAVTDFAAQLNDTSCLAVSVDGIPVGGINATKSLIPASNQKILVAAVALAVLGADYRFTTRVVATAPTNGVIAGDLYVVGGGDPLLTSSTYPTENDLNPVTSPTSLDRLAEAVVDAGVRRIEGAVVGDASRYDDELYAPSWPDDVRGIEGGPYEALLVNDARVTGDDLRADEPAEAAARELTSLLEARGVEVADGAESGTAPDGLNELAAVRSRKLPLVVGEMLATSDNNTAEMLVKELGVPSGAGTRRAGLDVMEATLEDWGVPSDGLVLADGSGLSSENRVSCQALLEVLAQSAPDSPLGAGLAVAGVSGTLSEVFVGSDVEGRLRAKTGTLGNAPFNADPPAVKALSGYLPVDGGGTVEFSLLLNGSGPLIDQSVYRPIWDALATTLATYPAGPSAADLGPR